MTMLAPSNANHKYYRRLRKKRKMKRKNQTIHDAQKPSTKSTLLTIFCLIGIFAILAYFRPN